ncbi:MAG: hypothetical protein QNL91_17815 [Candidatus Krumholzibacteria bacterium]|nr:hypothetical protein [Candidatus Krumholzibacteria bacterium]
MNSRALFLIAALMLGLFVLTGCSTDNNEHQRLVAEADLVNGGTPLVVAALNTNGTPVVDDDFVPIEFLNVLFSARPLNDTMVIPENGTFSTFNITHYDLVWVPSANAPAALTDYNVSRGNLSVSIPINDEVAASVLVGNLSMKAEAWFPGSPFIADLQVTFYGHESGSEHEVAVHAGTTVQFVAVVATD